MNKNGSDQPTYTSVGGFTNNVANAFADNFASACHNSAVHNDRLRLEFNISM